MRRKITEEKAVINEEARKRIVEGAVELYTKEGIKSVTMDDVANSLGMSKRTIYENFRDKSTLVYECVKAIMARHEARMREHERQADNVLELMMFGFSEMQNIFKNYNSRFFSDLKLFKMPEEYFTRKRVEHEFRTEQLLLRGVEQGLIRGEVKNARHAQLFNHVIENSLKTFVEDNPDISFYTAISELVNIMLRGICTDKGLKVMAEIHRKAQA